MSDKLSHLTEDGSAHMVDVSDKKITSRRAVAIGRVRMEPQTLKHVLAGDMKKGDVLGTARLAGIMAAKQTPALIPLCHPLMISKVTVEFEPDIESSSILVRAEVKVSGQTGVEMEALTAVSVACLTIYDMAKAVDKDMVIEGVKVQHKSGGKSGTYEAAS
ncbi:MAG: cyclic pyranopterin monophosphate synthase MoaC [Parvibaculaceae bacterium]|nr:cyclic pyranopterin monophosphate synthase MoaC [Parvibaculaceae bacterium]